MNFFWVNLGGSYDEVLEHKFLWAPQFSFNEVKETKYVNVGWSAVAKVKKGDLIFCYRNGEILRLAKALSDCYPADRPQSLTFDKWQKEGWKVDVELTEFRILLKPMNLKIFSSKIIILNVYLKFSLQKNNVRSFICQRSLQQLAYCF